MDWSDILRAALSFFLVVTGIGIAYVCFRLGAVFGQMSKSVRRMTDGTVPILERTQTTVDGINLQLTRVDDIMLSAVGATKGAEKAVGTVANAVGTPVRAFSGMAAKVQEQIRTLKGRRDARAADDQAGSNPPPRAERPTPPPTTRPEPEAVKVVPRPVPVVETPLAPIPAPEPVPDPEAVVRVAMSPPPGKPLAPSTLPIPEVVLASEPVSVQVPIVTVGKNGSRRVVELPYPSAASTVSNGTQAS